MNSGTPQSGGCPSSTSLKPFKTQAGHVCEGGGGGKRGGGVREGWRRPGERARIVWMYIALRVLGTQAKKSKKENDVVCISCKHVVCSGHGEGNEPGGASLPVPEGGFRDPRATSLAFRHLVVSLLAAQPPCERASYLRARAIHFFWTIYIYTPFPSGFTTLNPSSPPSPSLHYRPSHPLRLQRSAWTKSNQAFSASLHPLRTPSSMPLKSARRTKHAPPAP